MVCLIASGHVGTLPRTCWALLAAWGLADTPICPGSPKDILFDFFFFFPSCELGTEQLQWHEGCAQPEPRNGVGIVAQDLILKCGQRLMYLARNFSSPLLLVHKCTCIPVLQGTGQGAACLFSHHHFSRNKKYIPGRSIQALLCSCCRTPALGEIKKH